MSKKFERLSILKKTNEDWHPSFILENGDYAVRVSFIEMAEVSAEIPTTYGWRVCVWGDDDFGMDIDFPVSVYGQESRSLAMDVYRLVISMPKIAKRRLRELGFHNA